MTPKTRLFQEPYRLFFPLALLAGFAGVSHWLLYGAGLISGYSPALHASVQTQGYLTAFVFGFLFTVFPRMTASAPARAAEVLPVLTGLSITVILHFLSLSAAAYTFYALCLVFSLFFFISRLQSPKAPGLQTPIEMLWIPAAFFYGLLGALLLTAGEHLQASVEIIKTGKLLLDQGFILAIVIGAGGFLAPRIMGVFRPAVPPGTLPSDPLVSRTRKKQATLHLSGAAFLLFLFFLESTAHARAAAFLKAALVIFLFLKTRALCLRPLNRDLIARLIWVSFWMTACGYSAAALWPDHRAALLHLVFIGGFSLMTFSVGALIIFSHAGQPEKLKKSRMLVTVACCLASALAVRIAGSFFPEAYFMLLAAASAIWLFAAFFWLISTAPCLGKFPPSEHLEKLHEKAKNRLQQRRQPDSP